jgi:hypothetical protein
MANSLNPSSAISATYIQNIFEDAWFVAREETFMAPIVTNFSDPDEARARKSSEWGEATVVAIGETDDLQSQTFTPAVLATVTPAEAGAQFFLTDTRVSSDPFGVRADAAMELGLATAEKINTDLLGNFNSLTGGTVGAAGTTITWGYFFAALSQLKNQKAPPPYYCVLHTYQYHQLAKSASIAASTQPTSTWAVDEVMRRFWVQRVAEVDIFVTSDITVDTGDDAHGAMYSPVALALDMRRAPRLEPQRDASRRGVELNMTTVYGQGVWRPKFGICMTFDAAAPTS